MYPYKLLPRIWLFCKTEKRGKFKQDIRHNISYLQVFQNCILNNYLPFNHLKLTYYMKKSIKTYCPKGS